MKPETPRLVLLAYKLTADVVSKGVTLLVFVAAARILPADELGVLAIAMTTGWLLAVASDAGLPMDLARRVSQSTGAGAPRARLIADSMRWRAWLALAAAGAGIAAGLWLAPPARLLAFTVIVAAQLLTAVLETLAHAFRGLGRSDIEATVTLAQRACTGVAACSVLLLQPSLAGLAVALVLPPAVALAVSLAIARRLTGTIDPRPMRDESTVALRDRFLRDVAPMGLGIFLSAVYFRCDLFFIERWHGLEAAGIYNAAFRSVEALRLLPAALMAIVFPSFCTARTFVPLTTTSAWLLAAAAVPALALAFAAAPILDAIYGPSFIVAAPALRLLAWAVPLFFVNYALTHQVLAWDGQRAYLGIVVAALVTSLSANLTLVPSGGMQGAATATLLTEVVVAAGCLIALAVRADRGALTHADVIAPRDGYAATLPGDPA